MLSIPLFIVTLIMVAHFVGGFLFQTQRMAEGKSQYTSVLLFHSLMYTVPLFAIAPLIKHFMPEMRMWDWVVWNCVTHFLIDMVTSKMNHNWVAKYGFGRHLFITVGADQLIHTSILFATLFLTTP